MTDRLKPVIGFEKHYLVSIDGEILALRNKNGKRKLKPYIDKDGYCRVRLRGEGKTVWIGVHKIVAMAFLDNPNNYTMVNHKNFIRSDNRLENLEWCTPKENARWSIKHYKGHNQTPVICTDINGNKKVYTSLSEASKETGINISNICRCCKGRTKKAGGYRWEYERR